MSANHNYSAPIHGTPIHHAPTAPTALPGTHLVPVNIFGGDAAEEDRGQEAAAESQPSPVDVYDLHRDDDRQDVIGVGGTESVAMQDLQAAAGATAQGTSAAPSPFEVMVYFGMHAVQHDITTHQPLLCHLQQRPSMLLCSLMQSAVDKVQDQALGLQI